MDFISPQEAVDFYNNGYVVRKFKDTPVFSSFKALLKNIREEKIKDGYTWKVNESYWERCKDFKPDIYSYDPIILDLFVDQEIHAILGEITGLRDLILGFTKLRWNLQGKAYTTWHTDTNYYYGKIKGSTPSLIGFNYYPSFNESSEPILTLWPGTHHIMNRYKIFDWSTVTFKKGMPIHTNDDEYLIFDTAILHKLMPIHSPNGSVRLISQYAREFQRNIFEGKNDLHNLYYKRVISRQLL